MSSASLSSSAVPTDNHSARTVPAVHDAHEARTSLAMTLRPLAPWFVSTRGHRDLYQST